MTPSGGKGFEILEHTADVGVRASGRTLEDMFRNACVGMVEVLGAWTTGAPEARDRGREEITLEASDVEGLLVDWLNEVLFLLEAREACVEEVFVGRVAETGLRAAVELGECPGRPQGTEFKAATYHQLSIREQAGGYACTVFFDV